MSEALYRKYRSRSLSEIVGQTHVTDILTRALAKGVISHAYLLTGPRGVGKTSIARILAHEINGLEYSDDSTHLDIIEIDAASNNSVEDVRDLREKAHIAPVSATKKIYIIDEVHMLSKPAFNALLKTLEEPPEHVVFILATTDADKLPDTIISRTQRFNFRAITPTDAVKHLTYIAKKEKINVEPAALDLIAEHGDGSFRDSISLLDQLSSVTDAGEPVTRALVEQVLGLAPNDLVAKLIAAHETNDLKELVKLLAEAGSAGVPPALLAAQIAKAIRDDIATHPKLLPLLDSLLEVSRSSDPRTKLLTVLAADMTPKPKTAALNVAAPIISAPIKELEKKATQKHPQERVEPVVEIVVKPVAPASAQGDFDWNALVGHAQKNFVALYSVLNKCHGESDGAMLTIYARNTFYKKKLDDPKYRPKLIECLEAIGATELEITTLASVIPPKDSQTAAVAAIMGGGEEIEL